jgi:hypothetical protein
MMTKKSKSTLKGIAYLITHDEGRLARSNYLDALILHGPPDVLRDADVTEPSHPNKQKLLYERKLSDRELERFRNARPLR